ncbi:hypothetical protein Lal_00033560 [Lupinus albus]|nr:hypothetical protein Lal_00033560 [Lupinus albus]
MMGSYFEISNALPKTKGVNCSVVYPTHGPSRLGEILSLGRGSQNFQNQNTESLAWARPSHSSENLAQDLAQVIASFGSSDVASFGSSDVASFGSSDVSNSGSSYVASFGSSDVANFGSSDVPSFGSSDVANFGSSYVASIGSSDVTNFGSSYVANFGSSDVAGFGSSEVASFGSSDVANFGSSYVAILWLNLNQNTKPSPNSQLLVPPGPAEYRGLNEFCKQNPSQFQGGFAPDASNEWIQDLERVFRAMGCNDVQKVTYASYMLKYFPADLKRKKEMEFLRLERGNMSVGEYAAKFEELARFCPYAELEVDGKSKCSKFESGLKPKLKSMSGHQEIADFATLVNKCRMYEDDLAADEVATPKVIPPKNFEPQRNFSHGKGKGKGFLLLPLAFSVLLLPPWKARSLVLNSFGNVSHS